MNREEANQLKVTQLNDKMFRNHLEDCLSFGKPLLIENIEEELDPVLDPVLEKRLVKKGKTFVLQLADKEVDFADTFRLFCTTRLPNPHFTPELCAKVRQSSVRCGVFVLGALSYVSQGSIMRLRWDLMRRCQDTPSRPTSPLLLLITHNAASLSPDCAKIYHSTAFHHSLVCFDLS